MNHETMEKIIFIIDDDKVYLTVMMNHFKQMGGYNVHAYDEGDKALEKLGETNPFLIILDHHLTDSAKDGLYYLRKIKKIKPKVPTLYITGDNSASLKGEVEREGAKSLIVKGPGYLVKIRTAIDEIIAANEKKSKGILTRLFRKKK